jgi:mannosylglycoprotein endo-beta-mannosidase
LVWQDLWITGDCNGRWYDPRKKESQARRRAYPDDHTLFLNSVVDQIKMLRNHPSLYLWCGGNEFPPPDDIHDRLVREIFPLYDGTRYYLNESTSLDLSQHDIGGGGDGPYGIQDPVRFFNEPSYSFNPEIGSVGMPNVETMRKMISEKDLAPPENDRPNPVWQYHKYLGYGETIARFGQIHGIDDFCKKAQVVNYEQYRALQEGFNAGMWNRYTGMLVWKNQNPWTALRGQFYDVFLDQNGGFYGYMHAARPLHVQLNLNDSALCVVNHTLSDAVNQTVEAHLFDLRGKLLSIQRFQMDIPANSVRVAEKTDLLKKPTGLYFLRLMLKNEKGEIIDENLYWLTNKPTDLQELQTLADASLQLKIIKNDWEKSVVTIKNTGSETAFFIRLKVWNTKTNQIVLPVFFSDNYFTLFPGEQKSIDVDLSLLPAELKDIANLVLHAETNLFGLTCDVFLIS